MMLRYAIVSSPLHVSFINDPVDSLEKAAARYHDRPNSGPGPWKGIKNPEADASVATLSACPPEVVAFVLP